MTIHNMPQVTKLEILPVADDLMLVFLQPLLLHHK